jgi:hypothetical protein
MSLNSRLNRLEAALGCARPYLSVWDLLFHDVPVPEGFDPARDLHPRHLPMWNAFVTLAAENGYEDAREASDAGETGPEGMGNLPQEQATNDESIGHGSVEMPRQQTN